MGKKKNKKTNVFANIIISASVCMLAFITFMVMIQYWILKIPVTSDVAAVIGGFWMGELVTIATRQVFGSDVINKRKNESEDLP